MSAEIGSKLLEALMGAGDPGGSGNQSSAFRLGDVTEAGQGKILIACDGLPLDHEDLWINPTLDYKWTQDNGGVSLLRRRDRVLLLSLDNEHYYLICKAVKA